MLVTLTLVDNSNGLVDITTESLQKVSIAYIELYYIVPVDIVPTVSTLIKDEFSNLVNEIVSESLQYMKFGLNILGLYYIVYTCR